MRAVALEHLEGRQSVVAALRAGQRRFQIVLVRHGLHAEKTQDVLQAAAERGVAVRYVERAELDALAHGATHGGIMAICTAKPRMDESQLLDLVSRLREPALLLLLEGVDDARNLGFTLRSAEAFGAHAVLIKKHLWDFDAVEVARPASGAYERMPLVQVDGVGLVKQLKKKEVYVVGCIGNAKQSIHAMDLRLPTLLAIGGEKRGLSGAMRGICDEFAKIPMRAGASSLSLSAAAAVVLAEGMRQRLDVATE